MRAQKNRQGPKALADVWDDTLNNVKKATATASVTLVLVIIASTLMVILVLTHATPRAAHDTVSGGQQATDGLPVHGLLGAPQNGVGIRHGAVPALISATSQYTGTATWYCSSSSACTHSYPASGAYAAAGTEIRFPGWRGSWVRVCHGGDCVTVQLIDTCACSGNRIIDLYASQFRRLAPLSEGTIRVTVERIDGGKIESTPTGPPTDVEP